MDAEESKKVKRRWKRVSDREDAKTWPISFKKFATHVMIANSLAKNYKRTPRRRSSYASLGFSGSSSQGLKYKSKSSSRKPSSAETFPMSEEMKRALISLGKLHLLTEEDQLREEIELEQEVAEKNESRQRALDKFRVKTRTCVIYPQAFIRNIQDCIKEDLNRKNEDEKGNVLVSRESLVSPCASCKETKNEAKSSRDSVRKQLSQEKSTKRTLKSHYNNAESSRRSSILSESKRSTTFSQDHKQLQSFVAKTKTKTTCDSVCPSNTSASKLQKLHSTSVEGKTSNKIKNSTSLPNFVKNSSRLRQPIVNAWTAEITKYQTDNRKSRDYTKRRALSVPIDFSESEEIINRRKSVHLYTTEIQDKCRVWLEARGFVG